MALGGGTWLFQNKKLPGTYINFVSKHRAQLDIADRGYVTMGLELDWGPVDTVFRVEADEFMKESQAIFGYDYGNEKLHGLRELFINAKTGYFYRLNKDGIKASNKYATAKYPGIRGNDITISIQKDLDEETKFNVYTYLTTDGVMKAVDKQKVAKKEELKGNTYVDFKDFELEAGSEKLADGTNGSSVKVADYQAYLEAIEPYYFNIMAYAGTDDGVKDLLVNFCKRSREATGAKFQVVIHGKQKVNYVGVISVLNDVEGAEKGAAVYWLAGAEAACPINGSCTNKAYNGTYEIKTKYKQYELEQAIVNGMLVFHNVADSVSGDVKGETRILDDINTFTEFTKDMNSDFAFNQVIRVLDNAAIDVARIFNKLYLGKVQNDADGRISLWKDIIALFEEYQRVHAIQNLEEKDIPVPEQGLEKDAVLWFFEIQPTVAMQKLYTGISVR